MEPDTSRLESPAHASATSMISNPSEFVRSARQHMSDAQLRRLELTDPTTESPIPHRAQQIASAGQIIESSAQGSGSCAGTSPPLLVDQLTCVQMNRQKIIELATCEDPESLDLTIRRALHNVQADVLHGLPTIDDMCAFAENTSQGDTTSSIADTNSKIDCMSETEIVYFGSLAHERMFGQDRTTYR
jgi:hypothetical protein